MPLAYRKEEKYHDSPNEKKVYVESSESSEK
jgi:hypothetical protein